MSLGWHWIVTDAFLNVNLNLRNTINGFWVGTFIGLSHMNQVSKTWVTQYKEWVKAITQKPGRNSTNDDNLSEGHDDKSKGLFSQIQ